MNKKVLRNLSYGLYVIGAKEDRYVGCIANTVFQITSEPATIAISINHNNYTNEIIKKTKKFSVSILTDDANPEIIGTFGYSSSKDNDKFEKFDTKELEGLPILSESCGSIICEVENKIETSTHTIFLGKITNMDDYTEDKPMTYSYYHNVLKGKSPKNAPTYIEEKVETKKTVWKCTVCGYEVEMDEIAEDYRCPICGQPVTAFIKIEK